MGALLVLVIALTLSLLGACTNPPAKQAAWERPILIVGIDGLDWDVMLPLMKAGKLPALSELAGSGFAGRLATLRPTLSPAIWTTVATGALPARHGILGFVRNQPAGPVLYTSMDRRVKALWNITSDAGLPTLVVGWWNTFPVETINGVMVAQVNTSPTSRQKEPRPLKGGPVQGLVGQVHPSHRSDEILTIAAEVEADLESYGRRASSGADFTIDAVAAKLWEESLWSLRADVSYAAIATKLIAEKPDFSLGMVYLGLPDVVGHRFWRWAYPDHYLRKPSAEHVKEYGGIINAAYEETDRALGRILDQLPSNCLVIIASDHGMKPVNRAGNFHDPELPAKKLISAAHTAAPPGVLIVSGPDLAERAPFTPHAYKTAGDVPILGKVQDIAPTVLALLGLPIGEDLPGRVLKDLIAPEFRQEHVISKIASATEKGWKEANRARGAASEAEDERLDQLRDLGYIE